MKKYIVFGLIIGACIILYDLYFNKIKEGINNACIPKKPDLCVKILDNKEKIKQIDKKTSSVKKLFNKIFQQVQKNKKLSKNNEEANTSLEEEMSED
jgi:siroheme synthase (precorrin-2 oxidase/ferrochelatase)